METDSRGDRAGFPATRAASRYVYGFGLPIVGRPGPFKLCWGDAVDGDWSVADLRVEVAPIDVVGPYVEDFVCLHDNDCEAPRGES